MLVSTLAQSLGVEALAGNLVRLRRERPRSANAGRKIMALVVAMVLGTDSIMTAMCCGRAGPVARWGAESGAPSMLGRFLRAFTFRHVR
jgi:hypothetical protein